MGMMNSLRQGIDDVVAWVPKSGKLSGQLLRTPSLASGFLERPRYDGEPAHLAWPISSSIVEAVVEARREALRNRGLGPPRVSIPFRLLASWFPDSLRDGAAEIASSGFFDSDNQPPWDLWAGAIRDAIVAVVPSEWSAAVEMGIAVNPEGC